MPKKKPPQLAAVPHQPGVYQFKDTQGKLLYVGKAKDLKNRVSSYFHDRAQHSPRIEAMVAQVADLTYIVTQSEMEALILEANLIKTLRPHYNILMRDDKKYPWLMLTDEAYPRLVVTREPGRNRRAKYFGPYANPGDVYQTLQLLKTVFPLRKRRTPLFKDRPCMNYHIGACLGPCQQMVSPQEYAVMVKEVELFLKGQAKTLIKRLETEMKTASEALNFEGAAKARDRILAIERMMERQRVMVDDPRVSQDVLGMTFSPHTAYAAVLKIREGKLVHTAFYELATTPDTPPEEAYQAFLFQYYEAQTDPQTLPNTVVVQFEDDATPLLAQWLTQQVGHKVAVTHPKRGGQKQDILAMAIRNAEESEERSRIAAETKHRLDPMQALITLQDRLNLPELPLRMECYDISHVQGTHTVASMVVFTDGVPDKASYRQFNIQSVPEGKPDDFASMREAMTRRFSHLGEADWPTPDLVIIDGGKGQLSAAHGVMVELGLEDIPMVSLAKKFEEVFVPGKPRPVVIERDSSALFLLQQIRDEAHRFAITAHRRRRGKAQTASALDEIPGIGPKRKQKLLKTFGSIQGILDAPAEDVAKVLGGNNSLAKALRQSLKA